MLSTTARDVLRNVVDEANRRRDGRLPQELPGVAETFDDALALVTALQMRWHTRLAGRRAGAQRAPRRPRGRGRRRLAPRPPPTSPACARPRRPACDRPAPSWGRRCATAHRKDLVLMAAMAGRPTPSTAAAIRVGRQLEDAARAGLAADRRRRDVRPAAPSATAPDTVVRVDTDTTAGPAQPGQPSISYSITVRLEVPAGRHGDQPADHRRRGGRRHRHRPRRHRLRARPAPDRRHLRRLRHRARRPDRARRCAAIEGVAVHKVSDRTFLMHLGGTIEMAVQAPDPQP